MKFEIEPQDIEAIAQRVLDLLKPVLRGLPKDSEQDVIFDVKGLADYLHVDSSWVYKQMSLRSIPFFKAGRYCRFRKKEIDKWMEIQVSRAIPPLKTVKTKG